MKTVRHREGETVLLVPEASLSEDPPPTSPVFFNPAASQNRDISVAITSAAGGRTFCDSMAGVGARGLRVAKEVKGVSKDVMVDFNSRALAAAKRGAAANGVGRKCEFAVSETNSYLFSRFGRGRRFDFVDVDPFGSPIREMQGALSATAKGGILSVTATDTAALCGVHPATCLRRYGSVPLNNRFHHETGIRILLASLARVGGAVDIGIEPIAAHATRHYMRAYVRVLPGASLAEATLREVGRISWCPACGATATRPGDSPSCGACGGKVKGAGPLWLGKVVHDELVEAASKDAARRGFLRAAGVLGSLVGVDGFPPWSFDIAEACSRMRIPTVPEGGVFRRLADRGRRAMRTPFETRGTKTDASYAEFGEAVKAASMDGGR